MRLGVRRITKRQFYKRGGFANPLLFRLDRGRGGGWEYYEDGGYYG